MMVILSVNPGQPGWHALKVAAASQMPRLDQVHGRHRKPVSPWVVQRASFALAVSVAVLLMTAGWALLGPPVLGVLLFLAAFTDLLLDELEHHTTVGRRPLDGGA